MTAEDDLDVGAPGGPAASVVGTVHDGFEARAVRVAEFVGASPLAQPLPDGRVIICGTWAEWRPEGPDLNATAYGSDGTRSCRRVSGTASRTLPSPVTGRSG